MKMKRLSIAAIACALAVQALAMLADRTAFLNVSQVHRGGGKLERPEIGSRSK